MPRYAYDSHGLVASHHAVLRLLMAGPKGAPEMAHMIGEPVSQRVNKRLEKLRALGLVKRRLSKVPRGNVYYVYSITVKGRRVLA